MMRYQRPISHRHSTGDLYNSTDSLNDRFLSLDRRGEKKVARLREEERVAGKVTTQCDIFRTTETLLEVVLAEEVGTVVMIFLDEVSGQELARESSQVNISPTFLPFYLIFFSRR